MGKFLKFALALALGFGWALGASGQTECKTTQFPNGVPVQGTNGTDLFGTNHQNECLDPFTGRMFFPSLNMLNTAQLGASIQMVNSATAGADWCSKVVSKDAACGASNFCEIWVDQSANTGACSNGLINIPSSGHVLHFVGGGTYSLPFWNNNTFGHLAIVADIPTFIKFTGSQTNGLFFDGSALGNGMQDVTIRNIIWSGNANIANTAQFLSVNRSHFYDMQGLNATTNALWFRASISTSFSNVGYSCNFFDGAIIPVQCTTFPTNAVNFDTNPLATSASIANYGDIFAECGNHPGTGVAFTSFTGNHYLAIRTAEGCTTGVNLAGGSSANTLMIGDLEANTGNDLIVAGFKNRIFVRAASNIANAINVTGNDNRISGEAQSLTISAAGSGTDLDNFQYSTQAAGGVITDNSSPVTTVRWMVKNANTGVFDIASGGTAGIVGGRTPQFNNVQFSLHSANASSRNWCWAPDGTGAGFFELWKSSNNTNLDCISGESSVMQFDASGNVNFIGVTPTMPAIVAKGVLSVAGTGACATITTTAGGAWGGTGKCTGVTAASTITITPGITAPNGWTCDAWDETTSANVFKQTSHNGTTATLTAASVTTNDVFVFKCVGW